MPAPFVFAVTAPVGWIIVALVVYALVGIPVVFWGLTRTGKRGLAWILLTVLSAVATVGLWLYANQQAYR